MTVNESYLLMANVELPQVFMVSFLGGWGVQLLNLITEVLNYKVSFLKY